MSSPGTTTDIASVAAYNAGMPRDRYAELRRTPVAWHPWPGRGDGFWAVTGHAEVVAVSRDPHTYSSAIEHVALWDLEPDALEARRSLIETDPPDHNRLRRLVSGAFTPRKIREYTDGIRAITAGLLDAALAVGTGDWVELLSAPLPIAVIVQILGVDAEDADLMVELSDQLVAGTGNADLDPEAYGNTTDLRLLPFNSPAAFALFEYGRRLGAARRADPRNDLMSVLVAAEIDGDRLTDQELTNFFQILVFAGNETTRTALSHAALAFLDHPDQLERLHADPSLVPSAVEEILRWSTPVLHFRRTATTDTELGGVTIRAGDKVVMWFGAANFDERVFTDPETFDIARTPNDHVAFGGGGPHFCLGAFLARLEIGVFLDELIARGIRLAPAGAVERVSSNFVHGIKRLPVTVTAAHVTLASGTPAP